MKKVKKQSSKEKKVNPSRRILITAIDLFYQQGYNATGINQIIAESKVAKASFYDTYPSKESLAEKVLRKYQADILRWMRNILTKSSTSEAFVKNFAKAVQVQVKTEKGIYNGCPVAIFSAQFPYKNNLFQKEFIKITKTWEHLLSNYFRNLQNKKLLSKKVIPISLARKVLNLYEGSLIMWKLSKDNQYILEFEKQLQETVRRAWL